MTSEHINQDPNNNQIATFIPSAQNQFIIYNSLTDVVREGLLCVLAARV